MIICFYNIQKSIVSSKLNYVEQPTIYRKILSEMKYLLYYNLNSKFVTDQTAAGGDGTSVVSVVDGVAWTKDQEKTYYRYADNDAENLTSYTVTVHYIDEDGKQIISDDVKTISAYKNKSVVVYLQPRSIEYYIANDDPETLSVSQDTELTFHYTQNTDELANIPLTFEITSPGVIRWTAVATSYTCTISYKKNNDEWISITSNTGTSAPTINVVAGDVVQFKGNNNRYSDNYANTVNGFKGTTCGFNVKGNIMSLIDGTNFETLKTLSGKGYHTFHSLFSGCTGLSNATLLLLPATVLTGHCYQQMFIGCTGLRNTPKLPASQMTEAAYSSMFSGCTSLTVTPDLPATTLSKWCYDGMFANCTSLTYASPLKASVLQESCYEEMFVNCISLTGAPVICGTTLAKSCCSSMFMGCTSLSVAPNLPAKTLADSCYFYMFRECTNLVESPILEAVGLVNYCYYGMFYGCSKLNRITCLATRGFNATSSLTSWVTNVSSTGILVRETYVDSNSFPSGVNGKPSGWSTITNNSNEKYLTFLVTSSGNIKWKYKEVNGGSRQYKRTIYYRKNHETNWNTLTPTTAGVSFNVSVGDIVEFYGTAQFYEVYRDRQSDPEIHHHFSDTTAGFKISGNIMSLTQKTGFANKNLEAIAFAGSNFGVLFASCTTLTDASELLLPTNATYNCYDQMFAGCTSLTKAPTLPAKTLGQYSYMYMFRGCTNLNYIKCLATNISASSCLRDWVSGVQTTSGTFLKDQSMTSWPTGNDGIPSNWTVQDAS